MKGLNKINRNGGLNKLLATAYALMQLGCATVQENVRGDLRQSLDTLSKDQTDIGDPCTPEYIKKLPKLPDGCKYTCSDGYIAPRCLG